MLLGKKDPHERRGELEAAFS